MTSMSTSTQQPSRIYTFQFGLLCLSSLLFFFSFSMIIPELPDYLSGLGGEAYKGLIISLFTATAALSRPFSGKLTDLIGRKPVMYFGAVVCIVCSLLYPLLSTIVGFLFLRLIHGFSTGFTPTAVAALVADIVPAHKRGEAMGIWGLSSNIGTAMGPALGSTLVQWFSIEWMFYASALAAVLSISILLNIKETLLEKYSFRLQMLRIHRDEVIEKRVFPAALMMMTGVFGFGVVLTLIPDYSKALGIANKGLFFTFLTVSSFLVRFIAGKVSDKYGRLKVLYASSIVLIVAYSYLAMAQSAGQLFTGACLLGVAIGMHSPTVIAWTIDLSLEERRGRGMGTTYIAMEIGIGTGALVAGWLYGNQISHLPYPFWVSAGVVLVGFLSLLLFYNKRFTRTSATLKEED